MYILQDTRQGDMQRKCVEGDLSLDHNRSYQLVYLHIQRIF